MENRINHKTLLIIAISLAVAAVGLILYSKNKTFEKFIDTVSGLNLILSAQQELYIKDLHPSYQNKFRQFIKAIEATGWKVVITSGYRSFEKQAQLKKENSKNAAAGRSKHNYGMAIDINAQSGSKILRKASSKESWTNSGIPGIAEKMGLKWGGSFANYWDPIHFEIPLSMDLLVSQAQKQFGSDPKKVQGNRVEIV